MDIIKILSPNHNERKNNTHPNYLILHYTGTLTAEEARSTYLDAECGLSPHYMVEVDGKVTQFVEEGARAWHAGKSFWGGHEDMNSQSIGIEIVNGGHANGLPEFPAAQIDAVIELCQGIVKRNDITPMNVLGHSDIAPGRKLDPGELFPWEYLAQNGVGYWPDLTESGSDVSNLGVRTGLSQLGYTTDCEDVSLVREFQRHYEPELFSKNKQGQVSERTHALISCLLKEKQKNI